MLEIARTLGVHRSTVHKAQYLDETKPLSRGFDFPGRQR